MKPPTYDHSFAHRVCLFEDAAVAGLTPLALTRPAFDLLCGLTSLGEKQRRAFGSPPTGALVRPLLADVCALSHPELAVNDLAWLSAAPTALVNARWLPPAGATLPIPGPGVGLVGDEVAYAVVGPEQLADLSHLTLEEGLDTWKATLPTVPAGGRLIRHLWELVQLNGSAIVADVASAAALPPPAVGGTVVGPPERFLVAPTARVEPLVVADTTQGPVVVQDGAVVTAFSRLEGPCVIGPHTHVLGAKVRAGTTLGPHCRIGGEVEASIVQGYSNKYHDGFLGHAYVGEWVNLGAGTSNSDLRNDYGEVSVILDGRPVATGLTKVGCFLGDHTKTGLGTLLNTGTNAGAFCNLLPSGGFVPKYVPSFCRWWNGALTDDSDLEALLQTAAVVMGRRGQALTEAHRSLYRALWGQTAPERRRAVTVREERWLRRTA